jgi:hypothetical protein
MNSFTLSSATFACSGPGAAAFIETNMVTGFTHAAFGFILLLASCSYSLWDASINAAHNSGVEVQLPAISPTPRQSEPSALD